MNGLLAQSPARMIDPSITSAIFAPKAQNQTLLSVMLTDDPSEALALESWIDPDQRVPRQAEFEGPGWTRLEQIISEYLRNYFTVAARGTSVTISNELARQSVPARSFPFSTHLNLLGGTDEGIFVEPDDHIGG
jgi:hypothetical protein